MAMSNTGLSACLTLATGYRLLATPHSRTDSGNRVRGAGGEIHPVLMDGLPGGDALPEGDLAAWDAAKPLIGGEDAVAGEEPAVIPECLEIVGAWVGLIEAEAGCPPLRHSFRQSPAGECPE